MPMHLIMFRESEIKPAFPLFAFDGDLDSAADCVNYLNSKITIGQYSVKGVPTISGDFHVEF